MLNMLLIYLEYLLLCEQFLAWTSIRLLILDSNTNKQTNKQRKCPKANIILDDERLDYFSLRLGRVYDIQS